MSLPSATPRSTALPCSLCLTQGVSYQTASYQTWPWGQPGDPTLLCCASTSGLWSLFYASNLCGRNHGGTSSFIL